MAKLSNKAINPTNWKTVCLNLQTSDKIKDRQLASIIGILSKCCNQGAGLGKHVQRKLRGHTARGQKG